MDASWEEIRQHLGYRGLFITLRSTNTGNKSLILGVFKHEKVYL